MSIATAPAPTFDDVWRALMQLKDAQIETNKQMQETDRRMQETDRQMQETDRRMQETDRQMQETDKRISQVSKQIGELGGRLGEFVEEMVKPAAVRLFQDRGLDVHQVAKNLVAYNDNGQLISEIDLLVVNKSTAIAIECKSNLSIDDVKEHLERLDCFKQSFPQYGDYQVLGAVAAMVIPDSVGRYAYQKGLFVMAQNGDTILIKNDGKFNPKTW
jgi:hypothetical protein